uniref:Hepatocyte growth factor-regulated tyrosine kinase substrate n=1 Tax=Plectus sambesii TaxID=2011161 RepID=A0A914UMU4_9BILA
MAKRFERLLDKATDSTLLEPHWDAILDCVDAIRSAEVPVKTAMQSVRKRMHNENPHVAHHALLVLEACVKNCGEKVHTEIATKEVMEDIKHLAAETKADKVKEKILELVQCWSHAFKSKPEYKIVADTHNLMKLEGFEFPSLRESEAMFVAESAPDWADGDECFRCRTQFGLLTRKHHCRACGQIFCDKCSSRQMILPRYGIEKSVRVCETCFDKPQQQQPKGAEKEKTATGGGESSKPTLTADQKAAKERELKQREEEELQLVMALSQSEAEEKERQRQLMMYKMYNGPDQSAEMPINAGQNNRASGASSGPVSNGYKGTAPASARQR